MLHPGRPSLSLIVLLSSAACFGAGAQQGEPRNSPRTAPAPRVQLGVDVLIADGFKPLAGKRVGLITNPSGAASDLRSTLDVLHGAPGVKLVALFGPEHGVRGDMPAGEKIADRKDEATGLPVYSLYGETRKPTPAMLEGVEVLVFDIQDIGARSYTYISTMAVAMEAAAERGIGFVVLDRPNPLGGVRVEGRPLDLAFRSFVGHLPIPYLHGMTVGELAQMANGEGWLGTAAKARRNEGTAGQAANGEDAAAGENPVRCDLTVVPMRGWTRAMLWSDTGLTWVPTSPHIPQADTALYYAATGLFGELHVITEGVGYTLPFELAGAPWIDRNAFARELNGRKLPGVFFRPASFQPFYGRHAKTVCGGVHVLFTDRERVELSAIAFHVLDAARKLYPDQKLFGSPRDAMFDKVCGTDGVRKRFEAGRPLEEILAFWREGVEDFRQGRAKYQLYE